MTATGLKIIDDAAQSTNEWVNDVNERTGWDHKHRAYRLLRSVLHAIRDHLSADEAAQLAAQMPVLIRGVFYDGWNPSKTPVKERTREAFVERIQLLAKNRSKSALPGESLGVTDKVSHHIALQPGTRSSYILMGGFTPP